ncbi:MAG: hypothetical protein AB8B53_10635 [Flavobacteriales bacterium]
MVFDLANWIILGGAFYIILDAIPNGPLSWKLLSKYASRSDFAVKTIRSVGAFLLLLQLITVFIARDYFLFNEAPLISLGTPFLLCGLFSIPLLSQLFWLNPISKNQIGRTFISSLIVMSLFVFAGTVPFNMDEAESKSIFSTLGNSLFFNYICGTLLFFIVLDFWLLLKRNQIIK